jgi:hypothetical protein
MISCSWIVKIPNLCHSILRSFHVFFIHVLKTSTNPAQSARPSHGFIIGGFTFAKFVKELGCPQNSSELLQNFLWHIMAPWHKKEIWWPAAKAIHHLPIGYWMGMIPKLINRPVEKDGKNGKKWHAEIQNTKEGRRLRRQQIRCCCSWHRKLQLLYIYMIYIYMYIIWLYIYNHIYIICI